MSRAVGIGGLSRNGLAEQQSGQRRRQQLATVRTRDRVTL
jgi:hypothetical protein